MSRVSVIVPTRNRSRLLATTLRSVLWQRDVELDVIVVDDASTDNTADVVAGFDDPRITIVRHAQPQGPSAARNRGVREARAEWIGFVDDDDVWAPDKLVRQVTVAEDTGRDWVYVGVVNIGSQLEIVSGNIPPTPDDVVDALPQYNPIPGGGSNVILRRRLFSQVRGFDERFPPCEDWEMWIRLARAGLPASVSLPLMGYRLHVESSSLDAERILRGARMIEQVHATTVDWGRLHRWLAESFLRTDAHGRALGQFARATVHGQARGVVSDLGAILRRRVSRAFGSRHSQAVVGPEEAWMADALAWLNELEPTRSATADESGDR
jgi:glycosyltransferase involved in cell wall biosynthesis